MRIVSVAAFALLVACGGEPAFEEGTGGACSSSATA